MNKGLIFSSVFLTTTVIAEVRVNVGSTAPTISPNYTFVAIPSAEIDQYMPIGTGANGLPESLQGLWYMDGNPVPDEVITLATSDWDEDDRKLTIKVYAPNTFLWHATQLGKTFYNLAYQFQLTYEVKFNDEITEGYIQPIIEAKIGFIETAFKIPSWIAKFTMSYQQDGYWLRESSFFGRRVEPYDFRRIVNAEGEREAAYADYVNNAPAVTYLVQ